MRIKLTTRDKEVLACIRAQIEKDFKCRVSIRQLELKYGMNENKLRNGFRQEFGITIFSYQSCRQLAYAIELLKEPDYTIQEAAIRAGYKDISTFNRRFRQKMMTTPTAWRKCFFAGRRKNPDLPSFFPELHSRAV